MNLTNTCRTCLQSNIDEPVEISESIYEFIEDLNMQRIPRVHPDVKLPQSVCFDCYRNLIAFKRFFAQCRDAGEYFKMKLEKIQHERVESKATEIKTDDAFEEDDKIYRLTEDANDDLLELIENCEGEDEEIHNTYVGENTNRLSTDFKLEASESQHNIDSNMELETKELGYKHDLYSNEVNEYLDDNEQNSIIIVQYEECSESESGNKTSGTLVVLGEEDNNVESEDLNLIGNSNKRKRRFQCQFCDKSFSSRYDLQMHENIHNGIKPFTCNICGKSFRQKNILRTHETLHFGKTIKCEECGKTFARKSQLILHDRMHRNEKPFVCDYDDSCGAAFRERQHLLAHQKIHSGLREYQCQFCPRAFYHRKGLLGHMRDLHGSICYQCDLCKRSFNKPYKIRRHMQAMHALQLADVSQYKKKICSEEYSEDADDAAIMCDED